MLVIASTLSNNPRDDSTQLDYILIIFFVATDGEVLDSKQNKMWSWL